ncbi:ABC transporter permease [Gryllotalpicola kribbensis]|jgi:D-methionine transport system permease protein|uniref:ABC transporter permease n=1 Tax=Gryllotalpicola kribbensis TaxID=993084 RepID=A0ABP8AE96_9MICO
MTGFLNDLPTFYTAIWQTLVMVFAALVVSGALGLGIGILLYATAPGRLLENRAANVVTNVVVNIVRPVPFIIFIAAIAPLTVKVLGTYLFVQGAAFAISLAAAFAVSRIVEQNLVAVDPGVVEAARAMGASPARIIFTVLIPEGLGPLILGYTFVYVALVDMSAQAGAVGGGGLGDFAIQYGLNRFNYPIIYITVAVIIVIVQLGQFFGNWLARRVMRR